MGDCRHIDELVGFALAPFFESHNDFLCSTNTCCLPSSGTKELDLELENSQQHSWELCCLADLAETEQAKGCVRICWTLRLTPHPILPWRLQELLLGHQPPLLAATSLRWARLGSALQLCLGRLSLCLEASYLAPAHPYLIHPLIQKWKPHIPAWTAHGLTQAAPYLPLIFARPHLR